MKKEMIAANVIEKIRGFYSENDGIKLIRSYMFYSLFECEGKQFFILNDVWEHMGHPFSNEDIREEGHVFEMWNGENYILDNIPCLGTHLPMEEIYCWDYSEVLSYGWTKGFYRKVVKALYKRFDGYYGSDKNGKIFGVDNYIIIVDSNEKCNVYSPDTDMCQCYWMQIDDRKTIEWKNGINQKITKTKKTITKTISLDEPF